MRLKRNNEENTGADLERGYEKYAGSRWNSGSDAPFLRFLLGLLEQKVLLYAHFELYRAVFDF